MSWDLICLKPHSHRADGDETYACIYKSLNRIEKDGVRALQYLVRVVPLPLVAGRGGDQRLINMEEALFKVVVDLNEGKVLFDIGGAEAALPSLLRGGGLGSLAVSELIQWAQAQFGDFTVVSGRISSALLNYPNGEAIAVSCLKQLGFAVGKSPRGGLQFGAERVAQLSPHVNRNKVETATPALWFSNLSQDNLNMARQVQTLNEEITLLKEQLYQSSAQKRSALPLASGLLMGVVAGAALASMLFSV
ncbi:hypothetical protein [Ketobacter sp.]|uniref:hypothetical protein n=1 Tax=Ketobacter sp. TaxID=2083498 RepID=UPI0025C3B281|nr:hypothetical protein [Ketobacter sp.]